MANIKSKIKNIARIEKRRASNFAIKSRIKKAIRKAREAVEAKAENAAILVSHAHSLINKAATKGVFHPNKAARKNSRLDLFVAKHSQN
ncbi:30S ribosomal protein S20 [Mycoplasma phocimorsus]|uniref:Small ribosomal subunit protein bS20 n=2 Tax=Mycoplasma phocimorsus TaxID=3045839 RepID=A0AAJ1PS18_9MOLU|nr:30S ribosomal protein S20 [Mycoplasma phocimorsus]MDJ1645723.1 30S ribosomal protein S20 [Mycoplasma phocimorsus]MDJ1646226.1 30S ribosomal protein S20 [Mycoplasma phocimorsus]MDJ1646828.1 30S ribosomal protein S20 [Mycoplasma phocimorsus]MDJ1648504.1 30S ribosomal protein S20 [Mycoplasma phocimorsus]MDJ1648642.1 30S ribosomal protein S20 [Mycoplasma phocimorsus]